MQRGLGQTHMTVHKYATKHGETDVQTFAPAAFTFSLLSHLQPADGDMCIDARYTHLPLSLLQSHCLSACCGPLFRLPREGGGGCVPCSRHVPIPPLACATLHLQGIKSEPPESTEKKDKKIGPNENQKHRLSLSLSFSLSLSSSPLSLFCHELGKTREEEN